MSLFVCICVFQERRVLEGVWVFLVYQALMVIRVMLETQEKMVREDLLDLKVNNEIQSLNNLSVCTVGRMAKKDTCNKQSNPEASLPP